MRVGGGRHVVKMIEPIGAHVLQKFCFMHIAIYPNMVLYVKGWIVAATRNILWSAIFDRVSLRHRYQVFLL